MSLSFYSGANKHIAELLPAWTYTMYGIWYSILM